MIKRFIGKYEATWLSSVDAGGVNGSIYKFDASSRRAYERMFGHQNFRARDILSIAYRGKTIYERDESHYLATK